MSAAATYEPFVNTPPVMPTAESMSVVDVVKLQDKTTFLKVSFGRPGTKKKMSAAKIQTDADKSRLRADKIILKSEKLEIIRRADQEMREWIVNTILPFDTGVYMCPNDALPSVVAKLKAYKVSRQSLVEDAVYEYNTMRKEAKESLKSEYNPSDYLSLEEFKASFTFDWNILKMEVPDELKHVSPEMYDEETAKKLEQVQTVAGEIVTMMRVTFYELLTHLRDRLTPTDDGKQKRLHETALTSLQQFMVAFPWRNVQGDEELAGYVTELKGMLEGVNIEEFKKKGSDEFRNKVIGALDGIKSGMDGMVEIKGRKYRTE